MGTTKILKSDLGFEIQTLLTDLENAKGSKASLPVRLDDLDSLLKSAGWMKVEMLDTPIKEIIENLMGGKTDSGKTIVERVTSLEVLRGDISDLKTKVNMLGEYGSFNEVFGYDTNGNVNKHTVTGDVSFTIDYVYSDPVSGTLSYSEKKYKASDDKSVTIKKVYAYNAATGDITGINTTTTIV